MCDLDAAQPQPLAVDRPYIRKSDTSRALTITGSGFGATKGTGQVTLGSAVLATTTWNDKTIVATVPNTLASGPLRWPSGPATGRRASTV